MSPQPLSTYTRRNGKRPKKPITFRYGLPEGLPSHGWLVAQVIATYSRIEFVFLQITIDHTEDPSTISAIWTALISSSAQSVVVKAAILHTLKDPQHIRVFESAWARASVARKTRNKFAHGLWAYTDAVPHGLLWLEPAELAKHDAQIETVRRTAESLPEDVDVRDADLIMVYLKSHLEAELREMQRVLERVALARAYLRWPNALADLAQTELLPEPETQPGHNPAMKAPSPPLQS